MIIKNIEIKARINNYKNIQKLVGQICPKPESIEKQLDTFFTTEKGRLKLRETKNKSVLIYYDRENSTDPSPSDIIISFIDDPNVLKTVLSKALGIRGIIKKERTLYLYGQTRIHLDSVEELGNFVELEVVLKKDQCIEDGKVIARELIKSLNISDSDLVDCAYIDMLEHKFNQS